MSTQGTAVSGQNMGSAGQTKRKADGTRVMERWKPVFWKLGFHPCQFGYEASTLGRVRNSKTGRVLKPRINKHGYLLVDLHGKTYNLHAVIFRTFKGHPPTYMDDRREVAMDIDHRNARRCDARLRNLQPLTRSANIRKAMRQRGGAALVDLRTT